MVTEAQEIKRLKVEFDEKVAAGVSIMARLSTSDADFDKFLTAMRTKLSEDIRRVKNRN